jgi:hypothetical protein
MTAGRWQVWAIAAVLSVASALARAASFAEGVEVTKLPAFLHEVSGLAESRTNPGVFWVHNDSGDQPWVYAFSRAGASLGRYTLAGATAVDWEDMAIGPTGDGRSYLYLADIGDNAARRSSVCVYRVREPVVHANQSPVIESLSTVTRYDFTYPDGPRDAEGFMVDPLTGDFYVVSKQEPDGNRLYRSVSPSDRKLNTLERVGTFSTTGTTGSGISPDGLQVVIRRYSSILDRSAPPARAASYWRRPDASMSLVTLLAQPGQTVRLVAEAQGEAIAFAADNRGFYTTGEHGSRPGETTTQAALTFYAMVEP